MDPVLIALAALYLVGRNKRAVVGSVDTQAAPPANTDGSRMGDSPPVYAYLYQLPDDLFTTTRMASGKQGEAPTEMGIFSSPQQAAQIAQQKGWVLAWQGVKQLSARPGT